MQPSTDRSSGSGGAGRQLRRYGPIAAILVVLAVIAGVLVFAGGDDDGDGDKAATTGQQTSGGPKGVLSYEDAKDQGRLDDVTFPKGCDEKTGRVAIPSFFAPPCYADA